MYCFIVNKTSGNGKGWKIWNKVKKELEERKINYSVFFTEGPNHAVKIVENMPIEGIKAVVVIGGDGTIHEVGNGMVNLNVPLGVIPAGSGNDFARSLQIPSNYKQALNRILAGQTRRMDLGKIGRKNYLTVAGIGFDGRVAEVTNQSAIKKWLNKFNIGSLSYVYSVFKVLFEYKPTTVSINLDGKEFIFDEVWLIAVANLPFYGGGIHICPDAKSDDGLLEICIVHNVKKWELLLVFPRAFLGKHISHKNVKLMKAKNIIVQPTDALVVHSDGEIMDNQAIEISVHRDGLLVI